MVGNLTVPRQVEVRAIPVMTFERWSVDRYKDAREIPGDASPRRKKTALSKFKSLCFDERFELVRVVDQLHIEVRCKNCGNVFTREISCLKESRSDRCKSANNIKCVKCGMSANGTVGYTSSENKRGMDESEIVAYYKRGFSATQTAMKFGVNLRRVRRIIDDAGVSRDRQAVLQFDEYPSDMTGDPWLDEEFTCEECGRKFTRHQYMLVTGRKRRVVKPPRCCSRKCSAKKNARKSRHNRRMLEKEAGGDSIALSELMERDGGICYLCGRKVDMSDGFFDGGGNFHTGPLYPTIDHVIPLSKGGANTWDNVKLACLSCNSGKCDRTGFENETPA